MKIYLAAAWARKAEIRAIADDLNVLTTGVSVRARWLEEEEKSEYGGSDTVAFRRERARIDVEDVKSADVIVRFTDDLSAPTVPARLASGARMFEMGYAYALKKIIVVVGGVQPIFDYLPEIIHVKDMEELKLWILNEVSCG